MAVTEQGIVVETALWPQGDIRDPLGVWGSRVLLTGDASGGSIKATIIVSSEQRSAFVFCCYSAILVQLTGTPAGFVIKCRLLTNWPNIDIQAGVQAYATAIFDASSADLDFTSPSAGPARNLIGPNDRFIPLFDPRAPQSLGSLNILEIEGGSNVNGSTYSAECYGYFWDRSVMQAPGGLRHPGSS